MYLLINKPAGPTSHDVVNRLRHITGIKKIGHAGTLDPFASGLLIIAISRESTREIDKFVKLDKEYVATMRLGAVSDTYDKTGEIVRTEQCSVPTKRAIKDVLKKFNGEQKQTPPMFSAKKIQGQKLYHLARQGKTVERQPVKINIKKIKILKFKYPLLKISVACSSGTYIRSLANDIGEALGCGAYLEELERTKIGKYKLRKAAALEKLTSKNWAEYGF